MSETQGMDEELVRQWADALVIEESELPELSAEQGGVVYWTPDDDGGSFAAVRKIGLDPELAGQFDVWARQRAYIIATTGDVSIDGWFKRSIDDSWQITARTVWLADMSFLDEQSVQARSVIPDTSRHGREDQADGTR